MVQVQLDEAISFFNNFLLTILLKVGWDSVWVCHSRALILCTYHLLMLVNYWLSALCLYRLLKGWFLCWRVLICWWMVDKVLSGWWWLNLWTMENGNRCCILLLLFWSWINIEGFSNLSLSILIIWHILLHNLAMGILFSWDHTWLITFRHLPNCIDFLGVSLLWRLLEEVVLQWLLGLNRGRLLMVIRGALLMSLKLICLILWWCLIVSYGWIISLKLLNVGILLLNLLVVWICLVLVHAKELTLWNTLLNEVIVFVDIYIHLFVSRSSPSGLDSILLMLPRR